MKKSQLITLVKEVLQDFYNSKGNTPVDWEKRDWKLYEENKINYLIPNFDAEWEEAVRYPEFNNMGKEQWIRKARVGGPVQYSKIKNVLGNVDLDFESLEEPKKQRFQAAFQKGVIEMPIAVKFSNDDFDLVAGNTRLSGLVKNGIDPKIWIVDLSNLRENYVLQDLEDKFDIDLDLQDDGKSLTLSRIVIPKDKRGQGVGSKVMKLITQYADAQNKSIYLTPSKDFGATSTGRLEQFYKQFGFKKKDRSDFSTKETTVREPQTSENFADGKVKGKSRPGRVKKAGASCKGSVTDLRAKAKKYGGEKGKMYHWCANMKSGKK